MISLTDIRILRLNLVKSWPREVCLMLEVVNSEHYAGVKISGDHKDLLCLERAISDMTGNGRYEHYIDIERNLADLLYEIRGKNVDDGNYHEVKILWPDIIFDVLALSDFMNLTSGEDSYLQNSQEEMIKARLNREIIYLRFFEGLVLDAYSKIAKLQSYMAFYKIVHSPKLIFKDYYASYLYVLRETFLKRDIEKRADFIEVLPFMLVSKNESYQKYVERVRMAGYESINDNNKDDIVW